MPNNRTQNQVPHGHTPEVVSGVPSGAGAASHDLEVALGEIAEHQKQSSETESVLTTGPETFNVSDEVAGTIITDTKRDTWRFSDAVKRSLGKWVARKERTIKRTFTDKTIATKKIVSAATRIETVRKAATNVAPGDGVTSLRATPQVKNRVMRSAPVSSIRVKPKNVPKEIGDTQPRWKYIIESEEPTTPITQSTASVVKPAALLEAPEVPLLAPRTQPTTPAVTAREYRAPIAHLVSPASTALQPAEATVPVPTPVTPSATPNPVKKGVAPIMRQPVVQSPPKDDPRNATFAKLAEGRDEVNETLDEPLLEETPTIPAASPAENIRQPKRLLTGFRIPTIILLLFFGVVVVLSNVLWSRIPNSPSDTPLQIQEETLFSETVTLTGDNAATLLSLITTEEGVGSVSYRFITTNGAAFPTRNLISQLSGAEHVEFGSVAGTLFILARYPDYATALGIMLQAEPTLDAQLKTLFALPATYQFFDRVFESKAARVAERAGTPVLFYYVTQEGTVVITNTENALVLLMRELE